MQNSDSIFEEEEIYLKNLLENPDQFIGNSEFNEEAKNILKFKRIFNNITEDNNHNDFDELYLLVKDFSNHINNFFKKNLSENKKNKSPETLYRTNLFNKRSKAIILFIQLLFSKEEKDIKESILFINNYYNNIPNNTKIYKAIFLSLKIMCVSCIYFLSYKSFDINNITITINDMVQKNFITNEINNTFLSSSIIENEISNILSKEKYSIKKDLVFKDEISTLLSGELLKIMLGKMT